MLLVAAGYRVLRFSNDAIFDDLPAILETIRKSAKGEPSRPAQPIPRTSGW